MKKFAIVILAAFFTVALSAQTVKFGHINTSELVGLMSDTDSARVQLQAYQKELVDEMETMQI